MNDENEESIRAELKRSFRREKLKRDIPSFAFAFALVTAGIAFFLVWITSNGDLSAQAKDIVEVFVSFFGVAAAAGALFSTVSFVSNEEDPLSITAKLGATLVDHAQGVIFGRVKRIGALDAIESAPAKALARLLDEFEREGRSRPDFLNRPEDLFHLLNQIRWRLYAEEKRLRRNSVVNLAWGILFSGVGLGVLSVPLIYGQNVTYNHIDQFFTAYAPRISVVVVLELVSFFFLRLYWAVEQDIRYNRNEITNVELQFGGVLMADKLGASALTKDVALRLMDVERNFILRKGERTVSGSDGSESSTIKIDAAKLVHELLGGKMLK